MSYLSLLFPSAPQSLGNASAMNWNAELDLATKPYSGESTHTETVNAAGDFRLPSGIASLDHWLDLNA